MPLAIGARRGTISLPPVLDGLLLHLPLRKDSLGVSMDVAKHWESPTTETVDADGTRKNRKTGLVEDAILNTLRCERLGALLEGARVNYAIRSEELDNAAWVQTNVTVVANDATAPDGNNTADRIDDNGAAAEVTQALAGGVLTNNLQYTFSVYVLEDDATDFTLTLRDTGAAADRARGDFQWVAGALEVKSADVGTAGVEPIVGGWYRAWVVCPAAVIVGANAHGLRIYPTEDGGGGVGDGHWFWGAQLDGSGAGAPFPSSYIPTVAAAVARAADALVYTNVGDVHCDPVAGTILLAVTPESDGDQPVAEAYVYDITDGNDGVALFASTAFDTWRYQVRSGGGVVADLHVPGCVRRGITDVLATHWEANNFGLWINGVRVAVDIAGNAPAAMPNDIRLGDFAGGSQTYSNIAYVIIYDRVLTELEIRRVTEWIQQQLGVSDLPPVVEGLNFYAPMNQDETAMSFWKGYRETSEPTTQTVDSDGTYDQRTTQRVTPAVTNKLRVERPGGLLEGQRENLCLRAQEIDQAPWVSSGTPIVTPNTDVAPDGTTTADTIEDDSAVAYEWQYQSFTVPNDALSRVWSVYIRKTSGATSFPGIWLRYIGGVAVEGRAILNTNTGVVANLAFDGVGVEDAGDYWRVWGREANNASGNTTLHARLYPAISNDGTTLTAAAVGSKVFWGAQLEVAEFPSSYIPTVGASVIRSGDNLIYDNTADVHAEVTAGTAIVGFTPEWEIGEHEHTYGTLVDTRDAGNNDGVRLSLTNATGLPKFYVRSGAGATADINGVTLIGRGVPQVLAGSWEVNNFDLYVNGILEGSDGAGAVPTGQSDIRVGKRSLANDFYAFSNEAHLLIYNRVLTQPEILVVSKWILEKLPAGSLPPVTNGLTLMAPMTPGLEATSFVGGAHVEAPTTETVDADGTFVDPTNYDDTAGLAWVTDATLNELRRELYGGLIEIGRTNLLPRSEEINLAPWADENTPVTTPNTDVAPDGTTTADTIEDNDAGSHEGRRQDLVVPNDNARQLLCVYVKKTAGATTFPGIRMLYTGGAPPLAGAITINTNTGAIANRTDVAEPPDDSDIEDAGDYWRVWIVLANNASGNTTLRVFLFPAVNATGGGGWAVATVGSAVFWGAQVSRSYSYPSSYIPTAGASVLKSADLYAFDNVGDQHVEFTDGTILITISPQFDQAESGAAWLDIVNSIDANDGIRLYQSNGLFGFYVLSGGGAVANIAGTTVVRRNTPYVAAVTWIVNGFLLYVNGTLENSDVAGAAPTAMPNVIDVGHRGGGNSLSANVSYLLTFIRVLDADEVDLVSHWIRRRLQAWL